MRLTRRGFLRGAAATVAVSPFAFDPNWKPSERVPEWFRLGATFYPPQRRHYGEELGFAASHGEGPSRVRVGLVLHRSNARASAPEMVDEIRAQLLEHLWRAHRHHNAWHRRLARRFV